MTTDNTAITHTNGATILTGDAVELHRRAVILLNIKTHIRTGGRMRLSRGASPSRLMLLASGITGKTYNYRKPADIQRAADDLQRDVDTLRAAIPDVDERTRGEGAIIRPDVGGGVAG